ncbi:MAG: hypothetical protein KH250_01610 [Bifidobacterium longum]|nr:hypothetical protein [Bifidobacterium longum]
MDTQTTLIEVLTQPVVMLSMLAVLIALAVAVKMHLSEAKKADLVAAKPLCLNEEQTRSVTIRKRNRPTRVIVRMPAAYATDDEMNMWADTVAPRVGEGFQATEVRVIPQGFGRKAMYEITFAKLGSLR